MKTNLSKGALYLSASSIILMAAGYAVNIFLGRYLGPAEYGTYGVVIALMTAVNLMQTAGLPQAVAKYIAEDETNAEKILKTGFFLQIISTLIIVPLFFLIATPLAALLNDTSLITYLQLTALIFPFYGIFALYTGFYNGLHNFKKQAYLNGAYGITKVITVLGFVPFFHLYGVIIGFIISPLLAMIAGFHLPKVSTKAFPYKKLLLFSLPLIAFAIFANLMQSIDLFFIKALLHDEASAGFYTAGQNVARIPFFVVTALAAVLFPGISRSVKQNLPEQTKNLIRKALRLSLLILLPSITLLVATSTQITQLLYSSTYAPAAEPLRILLIGGGFFTLFTIFTFILSGAGSPTQSSILAGAGVLLSAFFCMFLIPMYGMSGAAYATMLSALFIMVIAGILVYNKFKVLFSLRMFANVFFAATSIGIIMQFMPTTPLLLPIAYLFLFCLYVFLLIILRELTNEDLNLVRSVLPKTIANKIKRV